MAACSGSGPIGPSIVPDRSLNWIQVDEPSSVWKADGFVAFRAELATQALKEHERIEVDVTVSSGDSEAVLLHTLYSRPGPRDRTLVVVVMKDGHSITEIDHLVPSEQGRWFLRPASLTFGSIRVFVLEDVDGLINVLKPHPRVAEVFQDMIGFPGIDPLPDVTREVFGALPLDRGPPQASDGFIRYLPGDTVTVRYRQPDGTVLQHQVVARQ